MQSTSPVENDADVFSLANRWQRCRLRSLDLVQPLSDADASVQSMDDCSPSKWHLAHTTWFLEEFILKPSVAGYRVFDDNFAFLFNSYYEAVGARHPRAKRGLLSRPSLDQIRDYRRYVDDALKRELANASLSADSLALLELGMNHEEQHQELLLTDILHLFAQNPLRPAYFHQPHLSPVSHRSKESQWVRYEGGIIEVGHDADGFAFDCETPRHEALIRPFALNSRLVSNRQWIEFIETGGYKQAKFWLSDGWRLAQTEGWNAPLYWEMRDGDWWQMTLSGMMPLDLDAPVCHVSFFEANAFAQFAGARLPTEFEWEHAASAQTVAGNLFDTRRLRPDSGHDDNQTPLAQLFGDVWEWTASPFMPYPGFSVADGAVGEYNGKFMNSQFVLRGGSCVTPPGHVRATYRNFFYPDQRWQFCGLRLAKDSK